ncbi:MAG: 16S rRNA (uracil(1498)-N(3))-methyltransferase [Clostridia bacterium]|nr:16S rRNA (uracil(1498)-N(3))-methyltransferase [Clostridia bacterium]
MPRRFITENYKINNNMIEIFDEAKHIQVTRNKIGDTIEINEYICKIVSIDKSSITCEIIGNAEKVGIPKTNITLYQALLKADKMEYVIQKSVELGVSKIVPFISKNVVVKVDEKDANKKVDRWNKIAIEAVKQCGRSDMVGVENVEKFSEMLNSLLSFDRVILAYENEKEPLKRVLREINSNEKIAIVIGSEGGFDIKEVEDILKNKNAVSVSLGERILRAETASLYLLSILMYELEG